MEKVIVLSGAGISAESGIKTFRDANGLWEGHDVMEVASPQGWVANKSLVLDFYNQRRRQLKTVEPNAAHVALAQLEQYFNTMVITQNVDNLHERGGSTNIVHLHGELTKVRSERNPFLISKTTEDVNIGDMASDGHQLRPHIVWFGEDVPEISRAISIISQANHVIIVGTSMQVYPAAGLVRYAPDLSTIYYIDPNPHISHELSLSPNLKVIPEKATLAIPRLVNDLISNV